MTDHILDKNEQLSKSEDNLTIYLTNLIQIIKYGLFVANKIKIDYFLVLL